MRTCPDLRYENLYRWTVDLQWCMIRKLKLVQCLQDSILQRRSVTFFIPIVSTNEWKCRMALQRDHQNTHGSLTRLSVFQEPKHPSRLRLVKTKNKDGSNSLCDFERVFASGRMQHLPANSIQDIPRLKGHQCEKVCGTYQASKISNQLFFVDAQHPHKI